MLLVHLLRIRFIIEEMTIWRGQQGGNTSGCPFTGANAAYPYLEVSAVSVTSRRHRTWLRDYKEQVCLFTRVFALIRSRRMVAWLVRSFRLGLVQYRVRGRWVRGRSTAGSNRRCR